MKDIDLDQPEERPPTGRLDPDRVDEDSGAPPKPPPVVDTRRYQWGVGVLGIVLVIAFSAYLFLKNGVVTPGIPAGKPLYKFVAPLATGDLEGDVNMKPRCDPNAPNPRAINICGRKPLVLDFFVTGNGGCKKAVDALQAVSSRFPEVTFAAVGVDENRSDTLKAVKTHHWTIPVAYDRDNAVGRVYGVEICPMIELARGDRVVARLIGDKWSHPDQLAAQIRAHLG